MVRSVVVLNAGGAGKKYKRSFRVARSKSASQSGTISAEHTLIRNHTCFPATALRV